MLKITSLGICLLSFFVLATYMFQQNKTWLLYWWQDHTESNNQYTLLLGSSSIARMPSKLIEACGKNKIYGFNNGTAEDIKKYLRYAKLGNAKRIIIYIGENDIARQEPPEVTFEQVKQIVEIIRRMTDVPIALASLKPSPARRFSHKEFKQFNEQLNTLISEQHDLSLIPYHSIASPSLYSRDQIHTNETGTKMFAGMLSSFCETN